MDLFVGGKLFFLISDFCLVSKEIIFIFIKHLRKIFLTPDSFGLIIIVLYFPPYSCHVLTFFTPVN